MSNESGIFLEDKNEGEKNNKQNQIETNNNSNYTNNKSVNYSQNVQQKLCMSLPKIVYNEKLSIERKHFQSSLHSNDELKFQSTLKMMKENETLCQEKLNTIKTELKSPIKERNQLKKKCDE